MSTTRIRLKPKRIYYGPDGDFSLYWTVNVSPAKKGVTIKGSALHALNGSAGMTIDCYFARSSMDDSNASSFPHEVFLAAFTKSTALIVDRVSGGTPSHAVLYEHSYAKIVEANDRRTLMGKDPSILEKEFNLRPPRLQRPSGTINTGRPINISRIARPFVHRGAMERAITAGLISPAIALQFSKSRNRAKSKAPSL